MVWSDLPHWIPQVTQPFIAQSPLKTRPGVFLLPLSIPRGPSQALDSIAPHPILVTPFWHWLVSALDLP